jgi:hypothetical protein
MATESKELLVIRAKQLQLLELALRLSNGDPIAGSALLRSTGDMWSLKFLIDPLDLFEMTSEAIACHLKRRDGK